jgi:hypothetical protein
MMVIDVDFAVYSVFDYARERVCVYVCVWLGVGVGRGVGAGVGL